MFGGVQRRSLPILLLPRPAKRAVAIAVDIALCAAALWLALLLRYGYTVELKGGPFLAFVVSSALALAVFHVFGLYRLVFRYSGWHAVRSIAMAVALYGFFFAIITIFWRFDTVPRTVGVIQPILMFFFVSGSRLLVRLLLGDDYKARVGVNLQKRVLIYGAGDAGRQLARSLVRSHLFQVVCFVDDDPEIHNRWVDGVKIFLPSQLKELAESRQIEEVWLAIPSIERQKQKDILLRLSEVRVQVRVLPSIGDISMGRVSINDLRSVEIADILARAPVDPDPDLMQLTIRNKVVLVTGAGGSIGSELCRQISQHAPKSLILLDHAEPALYQIEMELRKRYPDNSFRPVLSSLLDEKSLSRLFEAESIDTVYHAAAYKHVPLVEHNVKAGLLNNVMGTFSIAQQAAAAGVERFILVSTDKAVRPPNVMGATKRLAEVCLQGLAAENSNTVFSMVRFGNVLGSSGSVVPLFSQQIAEGGPVTLTDNRVTRYFMTIPEAAQLVVQAGAMAEGGEVFVLDMGEPVYILDLATRMIQLSGLRVKDEHDPDGDIEIKVTGLRPGEKLYEELLIDSDATQTAHPKIQMANERFMSHADFRHRMVELQKLFDDDASSAELKTFLKAVVPEYTPE